MVAQTLLGFRLLILHNTVMVIGRRAHYIFDKLGDLLLESVVRSEVDGVGPEVLYLISHDSPEALGDDAYLEE
jgi:hypothetical protein